MIDLALFRVGAGTTHIGTPIVNPGGPGATGIGYLQSAADLFPSGFDVISFDPRGVSRSHPVECASEADLDSSYNSPTVPRDAAELDVRLAQSTALGNARLLIRDGPGRTSYGQNLCVDQYVDQYLTDLDLPDPSTTCPR